MVNLIVKRFETPDEVRHFEKGRFEVVRIGSMILGRAIYEPGWKWSLHIGAATGRVLCEVDHIGMVLQGHARVVMRDGRQIELAPGDCFAIEPGHDSWVVGPEPYVSLHFMGADRYGVVEPIPPPTPQAGSPRIETSAVHAGEPRPGPEGSFVFPIFQSTIYSVEPGPGYHDLRYIRTNSTPTQRYLHDKLAALEGGEAAVATASGMAAITSTLLTLLQKGDHFLATDGLYGGTHDFVTQDAERLGWTYSFVNASRPETWRAALQPNTKVFFTETISNPLMGVPRLREIAEFGHEQRILTVIDNTFASPVNFSPLTVGFDLVIHSATKYLNGHDDLVAGCVIGRRELVERVRRTVNHYGGCLDPHAAFLVARGLKTLALRVCAQNANAMALATFLSEHPKVQDVRYPGLSSHPDHAVARALFKGFGGMLNLRLKGGPAAAERLMEALSIAYVAPSLGGVETLVLRPSTTSHAGLRPEERLRLGITDELLRVSCGIEHADDLIDDFRRALEEA